MGDMGEGALHEEESNGQAKKIKIWNGPAPRRSGRQTVGRNITWTWTRVIALQITDPSSHQRGRPTWKRKNAIVTHRNVTSGHRSQRGTAPRRTGRPTIGHNIIWTWTWTWIVQWLRLSPSKRPNRVGGFLLSPEDGNGYSFRNVFIIPDDGYSLETQ
jgi:hypothetical protein